MDPVILTSILRDYGPWGLVALFLTAIIIQWKTARADRKEFDKTIAEERSKREADARGFHMAQIQNVRDLGEREKAFNETIRIIAGRKS
jgi:hypothetical protein